MGRLPKITKGVKDRVSVRERLSPNTRRTLTGVLLATSVGLGLAGTADAKAVDTATKSAKQQVSAAAKAVVLQPASVEDEQHTYHRSHYSHYSHRSHYSHYSSR